MTKPRILHLAVAAVLALGLVSPAFAADVTTMRETVKATIAYNPNVKAFQEYRQAPSTTSNAPAAAGSPVLTRAPAGAWSSGATRPPVKEKPAARSTSAPIMTAAKPA